jgi:hypothetical protein
LHWREKYLFIKAFYRIGGYCFRSYNLPLDPRFSLSFLFLYICTLSKIGIKL